MWSASLSYFMTWIFFKKKSKTKQKQNKAFTHPREHIQKYLNSIAAGDMTKIQMKPSLFSAHKRHQPLLRLCQFIVMMTLLQLVKRFEGCLKQTRHSVSFLRLFLWHFDFLDADRQGSWVRERRTYLLTQWAKLAIDIQYLIACQQNYCD